MSKRATWIAVVLCAGALIAPVPCSLFAQSANSSDSNSPTLPASPASPPTPISPAAESKKPGPENPSIPTATATAADEDASRLQRLADRLSKGEPAAKKTFDAANDPTLPATPSSPASRGNATTVSQTSAVNRAAEANRQKLVDPSDLEPLGPRDNTNAGSISPEKDFGQSGDWVLNLITALGVVLVLVFLLRGSIGRWFVKGSAGHSSPVVEVLTRVSVAPRNHVLLLRVGSRILIVGDSSAGLRTLGEVEDAEEVADLLTSVATTKSSSASGGFRRLLQGFNGEYQDEEERGMHGHDESEVHVDRTRDRLSGLVGKLRTLTKGGRS